MDSFTTLNFRPAFSLRENNSKQIQNIFTSSNYQVNLNESNNQQNINSKAREYAHALIIERLFRKKGRVLNLNQSFSYTGSNADQYNDVVNTFYSSTSPTSALLNQVRNKSLRILGSNLSMFYNEPISRTFSARVSHSSDFFNETDDINSYNKSVISGKYDERNETLSNMLNRKAWNNVSTAQLTWRKKQFSVIPAINVQWMHVANYYTKKIDTIQNYMYIFPSLRLSWKQFYFSYQFSVDVPKASDLQPVVDNTNPLFQQLGNPGLQPTKTKNLSLRYIGYNPTNNSDMLVSLEYTTRENALVYERIVDPTGVQFSQPINVSGLNGFASAVNFSRQYKFNRKFKFMFRPNFQASYNEGIVSVNNKLTKMAVESFTSTLTWAINCNDKFEVNQRYFVNARKTVYEKKDWYKDAEVIYHFLESEIIVRPVRKWVVESSVSYRYNPNVGPGIIGTNLVWNAGVYYLFFKDDKGQLKLSVYDLLNQNVGVSRSVSENYSLDVQTTTLRRYFMLSFTYNIHKFAGEKVGGKQNPLFRF
jgi:hypothetical protein